MRISDWSSDVCSSDQPKTSRAATPRRWRCCHRWSACWRSSGSSRQARSEERHVGKEWVSTGRSRWSTYHQKKTQTPYLIMPLHIDVLTNTRIDDQTYLTQHTSINSNKPTHRPL